MTKEGRTEDEKKEGNKEGGKEGRGGRWEKGKQPFNYFIGSLIGKVLNGLFSNGILLK